jgi:hypothetical protein
LILAGICLTLGLAACKPQETPLPFETLAHGSARLIDSQGMAYGSSYDKMDLLVATDLTETRQIETTLSPRDPSLHLKEIDNVNYDEYFVVVAFFGPRPYGDSAITIERIIQTGDTINVIVSTVEPTEGTRVIVAPIHAVKIKRADLPVKGELAFNLLKDDRIVLTRKHFVP